ncbi:MAG: GNAT family N-acetyltransferase [Planctomycetaceae bacterium]|jgi:ribosomal protein S18 acetylase RimI-like enzyme|nr:GNAT family N-acetyltransferase [Planctomycetaceae bacterium]
MLSIRPFRNEDPPRLVELWRKCRYSNPQQQTLAHLSLNQLQAQVFGLPMTDTRCVMLAVDGSEPVGYVHTALAPVGDGSQPGNTTGHICFLCAAPAYHDKKKVVAGLITAAEKYLSGCGVQEIFGGSPTPSAPFYTGFYGGGESVAVLQSDTDIVQGFLDAGYIIHQKTVWFHLDIRDYEPPAMTDVLQWMHIVTIELNETPRAKSWWEGCILANGQWVEATAYSNETSRAIARVRIRIACPDAAEDFAMYGGSWTASLMDIRVHPDFRHKGVATFLLAELLQHLIARRQIMQIDAHIAEDSIAVYALLNALNWEQKETGFIFFKPIH